MVAADEDGTLLDDPPVHESGGASMSGVTSTEIGSSTGKFDEAWTIIAQRPDRYPTRDYGGLAPSMEVLPPDDQEPPRPVVVA